MPRFLTILAAGLTVLVFGAANGLLGPLLPTIAREFNTPVEIAGLLLGITYFGSVVSVVAGGYLADRFGKRLLFAISIAGLAAAYGMFTVAPSFTVIAIACLLAGALGGTLEGLCSAVIADLDKVNVNRNMNLLQVVFTVGAVTAIIVGARFQAIGIDWRAAYLVTAIGGGIAFLASLGMKTTPTPHTHEAMSMPVLMRVVKDRSVLLLSLAIFLYVGSEMSLGSWVSPILEKSFRYPPSNAMMGAALFWSTMGVGRVISGMLCHRFSGETLLRWHIATGIASYVVLLLPLGVWSIWVGAGLAGLTFSGVWPLIVGLGNTRYPAYSGTVTALLVASGTVGAMVFPSLLGFVIERGSYRLGLLFMAVLFVLLGLTFARYARKVRPLPATEIEEPAG